MTRDAALRMLGLEGAPTANQVEVARRTLLASLHPDKHPPEQRAVFERLTCDVLLAAKFLLQHVDDSDSEGEGPTPDVDVRVSEQFHKVVDEKAGAIARFDQRFASDSKLLVSVLGLDPNHHYYINNESRDATALYVVVQNRTKKRVQHLYVNNAVLLDDCGNQYSSDGNFYWISGPGKYQIHAFDLAPRAKLDGFLAYPPLRSGARHFTRWFLADNFRLGDQYIDGEYDVSLPTIPQYEARAEALRLSLDMPGLTDDEDDDWD